MLQEYIQNVLQNPVAGGIIGASVIVSTLWTLIRGLPRKLFAWVYHHLVISVEVVDSKNGLEFTMVDHLIAELVPETKRRRLSLSNLSYSQGVELASAPDHFFFFRGLRPFRFTKKRHEKENAAPEDTITIETIGRSPDALKSLLALAAPKPLSPDHPTRTVFRGISGSNAERLRSLSSFVLPGTQLEDLVQDMRMFYEAEEWYYKRGLPFQRGYLFEGPPGTGKTSLATSLAMALDPRTIVSVYNLEKFTENEFISDISKYVAGTFFPRIFILEEVDTVQGALARKEEGGASPPYNGVRLSTLLGLLDGSLKPFPGAIYILTTNHPEKLDPALVRSGRIDRREHFGLFGPDEVYRLALIFLEDEGEARAFASKVQTPIAPCDVQALLMQECRVAAPPPARRKSLVDLVKGQPQARRDNVADTLSLHLNHSDREGGKMSWPEPKQVLLKNTADS